MRVRLVSAHNPGPLTGGGTNTYLIDGVQPTLIDAGSGEPRHLDELSAALGAADPEASRRLDRVLVTHAHPDHAAGAAAIAGRWPGVSFAKRPWPERDQRFSVAFVPLADGDMVPAGDGVLWVVHTPGHSPDHLAFFDTHTGVLFAGDLVMNGGTVVIPVSAGGNLGEYLASLRKVLELQPRRILAGHGAPIEHPAALIRSYIAHRLTRERQVLDALGSGPASASALVEHIYRELPDSMRWAAAENVTAHLHKLRDEGAVACEAGDDSQERWRRSAS